MLPETGYTPANLRALLKIHDSNREQAADMLGVTLRAVHRWCTDLESKQHRDMPLEKWNELLELLDMGIKKTGEGRYTIEGDPIRGFGWRLIRKPGIGTYAVIAGTEESPDDVHIVIEEYPDPQHRAVWDDAPLQKVVEWAKDEILNEIEAAGR